MHEMGIALEVYEQCRQAVSEYGPGRLETISLAVGELSAVEPELIVFAWEAVTADTVDAASRIEVRWCPARQTCASCGLIEARVEGSWLRLCPKCSMPLLVEGGDELDIERIEYATDDDKGEG
jgi:hydrogenase nickel incorporation protein HypA/HybF